MIQLKLTDKLEVVEAVELAKLGRPEGICLNGKNILVADSLLNQIVEISLT